jgi:hypothetical protein
MPERRFETAYWSDPFVMKLPAKAKLLYAYLWTNLHCNQAGLYEIAPETISFETGLPQEEVPKLLRDLEPKVAWYPEQNLVWVKNFLRHQTKSPQFLAAAAKCLKSINNNGLVREFLEYNQKYTLSIPYQYPINRESISDSDTHSHTDSHSYADSQKIGEIGVVKGKGGKRIFGEARNVELAPKEYEELVKRLGEQEANWWIDELSLAKASKGYKSKSDYFTILAWKRRTQRQKGYIGGADKRHTEPPKLENWANKPLRPATGNLGGWTKDKPLR